MKPTPRSGWFVPQRSGSDLGRNHGVTKRGVGNGKSTGEEQSHRHDAGSSVGPVVFAAVRWD